jgi:hypothetical protein
MLYVIASSAIYSMLDLCMLLTQGKPVFFGAASLMVDYFTSVGYPCGQYINPLDHYMDVVSADHRSDELSDASARRIVTLSSCYQTSTLHQQVIHDIDTLKASPLPLTRSGTTRIAGNALLSEYGMI